jgi:hypothetical protein
MVIMLGSTAWPQTEGAGLSGKRNCVYLKGVRDMQRKIGNVSFFYDRTICLPYFDKNQTCNYLGGSSLISLQNTL